MASLPRLKIANWHTVDWDMVLSPGEPIVLEKDGSCYLKIGDGFRALDALPLIEKQQSLRSCENCTHLCKINRNKIYAVCDEVGKTFHLWQEDTRNWNDCNKFIPIYDGYGDEEP